MSLLIANFWDSRVHRTLDVSNFQESEKIDVCESVVLSDAYTMANDKGTRRDSQLESAERGRTARGEPKEGVINR